jgi:hypothetical protein
LVLGKLRKQIENFLVEKKDIADLVLDIQEGLYDIGRNMN